MEKQTVAIEYDEATGNYCVICTPGPVTGLGRTKQEAIRFAIECDFGIVIRRIE